MVDFVFRVCVVFCLTVLLNGQETDVVGGSQTNTTATPSLPHDTTPGLGITGTNIPDQQPSPAADNSTNIDSGTDGEADDLASYIVEKIGQLFDSDTEKDTVVSTTPGQPTLVDCQHVADLRDYYPGEVPFEGNTTVKYLLESVFKPDVVNLLQADCARGSWCLSGYTQKFDGRGPFCYTEVWSALNSMMRLRESCDEKELTLLTNVINLLCGLCSEGTQDCCTRTLEALYVTYADLTHPNGTQKEALAYDDCNEYKVQMTKTYLCADDICYFDQRVLLESFDAWRVISTNASSLVQKCNITDQCQSLMSTSPSFYGDYSDELSKDYEQELEELVEELEKINEGLSTQQPTPAFRDNEEISTPAFTDNEEINPKIFNQDEYTGDNSEINNENTYGVDTDRTMLLGLISMTIVLVLGLMAVAYVGLKKYRRHLYANYRRGYSQLREEESKMLRQEYN